MKEKITALLSEYCDMTPGLRRILVQEIVNIASTNIDIKSKVSKMSHDEIFSLFKMLSGKLSISERIDALMD